MQMKQLGSLRRSAQAGFTLIELIVVIVILGILAATALPKFADLGKDARISKIKGARGAVLSASNMAHAKWLVDGAKTSAGSVVLDGNTITVNSAGYPTADADGILVAASISDKDFNIASSSGYVISTDSDHTTCSFSYTATSGAVSDVTTTGC